MKIVVRVLAVAGLALVALIAVVLLRAVTWKAPNYDARASLPPVAAVDVDAAARHLGEAIRLQTVSNQDPADNAWGEWDRLHAWMQATYPAAHRGLTRTELGRTLIYARPGADPSLKPLVLMAHQDVVPVDPTTLGRWKHAPFSGEIADGAVWGRGAMDDKGSLVGILEAVDLLARQGWRPRRTVYLVFGHDEEAGGSGARAAAAWFKAHGVTPELVLDEGGLSLTADPLNHRPMALIGVAEKGYATLKITARGDGGHSSAPPEQTAVQVLAKAVDRIASDQLPLTFDGPGADTLKALSADAPFTTRALMANSWLFGPLLGKTVGKTPVGAAQLRTTIAPTVLVGSPKENVLPQTATALINYRVHPRDSLDSLMARARRDVKGLPVTLEWLPGARGASPSARIDSPSWTILSALARETTQARTVPGPLTAATDGRAMNALTPNVYRFLPIVLEPDELEMFHGADEHLSLANVGRMVQFYRRLLIAAAG